MSGRATAVQAGIRLCSLEEIEDGRARGFDPLAEGRDRLFVVRRGGDFFAYRNACPHPGYEGTTMAWRKHAYLNSAGDRIVCSGHGANFSVSSGDCISGPCAGRALERAGVTLAEDGCLYWSDSDIQEN